MSPKPSWKIVASATIAVCLAGGLAFEFWRHETASRAVASLYQNAESLKEGPNEVTVDLIMESDFMEEEGAPGAGSSVSSARMRAEELLAKDTTARDDGAVAQVIALYREYLSLTPRERWPDLWTRAQFGLGDALLTRIHRMTHAFLVLPRQLMHDYQQIALH